MWIPVHQCATMGHRFLIPKGGEKKKKKKKHRYSPPSLCRQGQRPRPRINSDCRGQHTVRSIGYQSCLHSVTIGLVVDGVDSLGPEGATRSTAARVSHRNSVGGKGGMFSCGEGIAGRDSPHHRHVAWGPRFCICKALPCHAPEQSISTMSLGTSTNW